MNLIKKNVKHLKKIEFYIFSTLLLLPIFLRFITKLSSIEVLNTKYLLSTLVSFIIVDFIIKSSEGLFSVLRVDLSKSLKFLLFNLFLFCISSLFSLMRINISFGFQVGLLFFISNLLLIANINNLSYKLRQLINVIIITIANKHIDYFSYDRREIAGDVERWQYPNIDKIFNNNLIDVFQNPIDDLGYFYINLLVLANFYFAIISKIVLINNSFIPLAIVPLTTFILANYFLYETNLRKNTKAMIFIFNLLVLFINDWVRYLLIDSYMQEGVVSVFFAIIFYNFGNVLQQKGYIKYFILILFSYFIFSKLFINLFIFILPVLFFKNLKINNFIKTTFIMFFGFANLVIILFLFPKNNLNSFERSVDISNLKYIFNYWLEDLMFMYIILCTIVLFLFNVFNKREINPIIVKGLTISFLNLLVILILYTTLWSSGEEFESSYRYYLQMYYINLLVLGYLTDKLNI